MSLKPLHRRGQQCATDDKAICQAPAPCRDNQYIKIEPQEPETFPSLASPPFYGLEGRDRVMGHCSGLL